MTTAQIIFEQIKATTPQNVIGSWGISKMTPTKYREMEGLALKVNGFIHKGWVFILLNEGADLYEVTTFKRDMTPKEIIKDVFCEELGHLLDTLIERPAGQTDAEYREKVDKAVYYL